MPLLDSFKVDHTIMPAPSVRLAKNMMTPKGDPINVYDLRFVRPNHELLDSRGIHTLEHLFAGFMRQFLNSSLVEIIDISPMGCRTGFYMSLIGTPTMESVRDAFLQSMHAILTIKDQSQIPELNEYQCGSYKEHSLPETHKIAQNIIDKGIVINNNADLLLSDEFLRSLGNKTS